MSVQLAENLDECLTAHAKGVVDDQGNIVFMSDLSEPLDRADNGSTARSHLRQLG